MAQQLEVQAIVENLIKEEENATMEGELLKKKMIRQLYKLLGEPTKEDFEDEMKPAGTWWEKISGYTTWMSMMTENKMEMENNAPTEWNVQRPSRTKMEIVENYTRHGWHCRVQAFNVMCNKYVKHPRYKNIWVRFYSSRDCNKYEYVIEMEEK